MNAADAIQLAMLGLLLAGCIVGAPLWLSAQFAALRKEIVDSRHATVKQLAGQIMKIDADLDDLRVRVTKLEAKAR